MRVWLSIMEGVAEMTNYNFREIYEMPVLEFFGYASYLRYKAQKEKEALDQIKRKNHRH